MTITGSGEIKMSHIWNEIDSNDPTADGQSTNQNIRLAGLSDGTMDSINEANDAANRPDQSAPHQMSEFYLYDHDAESDDLDVPGNLHEDNVDHDSMTLDWNQVTYDGSPVDSYEVIWGTYAARTNAGNTTVTNITNTYYALSSLNASTNYYWWIRSKETDHPDTYSAWSGTQIRGTSAVPTTYSGTIADFSMSTSVLGTVYSVVKSFTVNDPSGNMTVTMPMQSGGGTLSVGATDDGSDPSSYTSAGSGTLITLTSVSDGDTIKAKWKYVGWSSAVTKSWTTTFTCNGASDSVTITTSTTSGGFGGGGGISDRRLKTNIKLVGHSDSGIPIYTFNFKSDLDKMMMPLYRGVMAQDLLEMGFDDAVSTNEDGYYIVDYDKIDVDEEQI